MILSNAKTPFQARKTKSSKSRNIDIFPKELSHGFGKKMTIFPTFFLYAIQTRKMYSMIFQNEKTPKKTTSSKSRKINIFPNGLTHGFGAKIAIFFNLFFYAIQTTKMYSMIFENEKTLFWLKKLDAQKVEKLTFFQRG